MSEAAPGIGFLPGVHRIDRGPRLDTGTISVAIANKILNWLLRKRELQAPRDPATGRYLLSSGVAYRGVLILCALLFLSFLALGITFRDEPVSWAVYSAVFLLPALGTLCCIHEVLVVRISFSEDGILRQGGLGPTLAEFASRRMASGPAGGAPPLLLEKALNPVQTRRAA